MTTFSEATKIFLKNPATHSNKVLPFLNSKYQIILRKTAEALKIEKYSKPYPGHRELLELINYKNGYYIVCGANDGYMVDPTYYYEKFMGWHGILIEPLPKAAAACKKNRPGSTICEAALVSDNYPTTTIEIYDCNAMSVTKTSSFNIKEWINEGEIAQNIKSTQITVSAQTLNQILSTQKIPKIDLLVIDVEGSEEEVLKGFDIEKYKPKYILCEIHTQEIKERIESLLNNQYKLLRKTGFADYLYTRNNLT